jgi:c-di-GMP-binding flagellar brake protein YcgR
MPWGPDRRGRLVDLSAGGCCVVLSRSVPVGTLLQTDISVQGRIERPSAQVVFCARVHEDDADRWRHGLRFEGLTEADHERLSREVVRRETRAVRQQAEEAAAAVAEHATPPQT